MYRCPLYKLLNMYSKKWCHPVQEEILQIMVRLFVVFVWVFLFVFFRFFIFLCVYASALLFYFILIWFSVFLFIVCVVVFFRVGLFKNIDYRSEWADTYKILDGNGAIWQTAITVAVLNKNGQIKISDYICFHSFLILVKMASCSYLRAWSVTHLTQ